MSAPGGLNINNIQIGDRFRANHPQNGYVHWIVTEVRRAPNDIDAIIINPFDLATNEPIDDFTTLVPLDILNSANSNYTYIPPSQGGRRRRSRKSRKSRRTKRRRTRQVRRVRRY